MNTIIECTNLRKEFVYTQKDKTKGFLSNLLNPDRKKIIAVDGISLTIQRGESIGFIGPNGAGKSTTIKMLTGILNPTAGSVVVAGFTPAVHRQSLSYKIGCVFGQRSQLVFNLPSRDSFMLFGKLYDIPEKILKQRVDELIALMNLSEFVDQPVRKLSLGQRMRCEIACSLIHDPEIIFLDEPTIGLDVVAKKNLREVLQMLNEKKGTTLFLTSHDMGDIEALCQRTVIVNHGKIVVDEKTSTLKQKYLAVKIVTIDFEKKVDFSAPTFSKIIEQSELQVKLEVDVAKTTINAVLQEIMQKYPVVDVDIDKPTLESIIGMIYEQKQDD